MTEFFFRIKDIPNNVELIPIDYAPEPSKDGDRFLVFVAGKLNALGVYERAGNELHALKVFEKPIDLREFYEKLSFIDFVNERTYKVFAKK